MRRSLLRCTYQSCLTTGCGVHVGTGVGVGTGGIEWIAAAVWTNVGSPATHVFSGFCRSGATAQAVRKSNDNKTASTRFTS